MPPFNCDSPMCPNTAGIHFTRIENRVVTEQKRRCREHAKELVTRYMQPSAMSGVAFANKPGATSFDLDYMIFDEEKGICLIGIREVGGNRQLSFGTGYCEAAALDVALQPVTSPRPLTHHAMVSLITAMGGHLHQVVIDKFFPEQKYYESKLNVQQAGATLPVDVRPSDAVILAVICNVPIIVSNDVLAASEESQE